MQFPAIDPVAFSIGSLQLRWYGLMYLLAFFVGWGLARWRASRPGSGWKTVDVDDLLTFVMLGVILGARLGYVLFYDLPAYIDDPGEILRIWNGGMSFHGGLLGVLCAFWYFARTRKKPFLGVSVSIGPLVPQGLFWGRMGNFINGELWGKVSDVPWAMVFPTGGPWPRHPSQLYEGLLEGLVLFVVLWIFSARIRAGRERATPFRVSEAVRWSFSSRFWASQVSSAWAQSSAWACPKTWGWRNTIFWATPSTTSSKVKSPSSRAIWAWNTTWSRTSPSSSFRCSGSFSSMASTTS